MSKRFAFLCGFVGIFLAFVFLLTAIAKPPTDGMKLWLKASLGVTLNGSAVSKWADQSSSKADAAQATATNQPVLEKNSINGQPSVVFDGVNDFMTFTLPVNGLAGMTIYLVSAATKDVTPPFPYCQNAAVFWNESASWGTLHLTPLQKTVWMRFGTGQTQTLPVKFDYKTPVGDKFTITAAMMDGVNDYLYVNGEMVLQNKKPQGLTGNNKDIGNLGRGYNDDTYFPGKIAEVIVYNKKLSDAERNQADQYLNVDYMGASAVLPVHKLTTEWGHVKSGSY